MSTPPLSNGNPLLSGWNTPFETPPFDRIKPEHFKPAFEFALAAQRGEVEAIAHTSAPPTFENTIAALEDSARILRRVSAVFFNLAGADTNKALQEIEREMMPILARHRSAIYLDPDLFQRIETLWSKRGELGLKAEQKRVLQRYHTIFVRNGGKLGPEAKRRVAAINERLATLGTQFGQNLLADENAASLILETADDLSGLPEAVIAAAAKAAADRGLPGKHVITLSRSSIEPFLQFSTRRDLREQAFRAWISRGATGGPTDNRSIVAETIALRAERAKLLGYETFAQFRLEDTMAKTPDAALALLQSVWQPARAQALREEQALQAIITSEGENFEIAPWDWRFYAEKRRRAEFAFDETAIKAYLSLDRMIEAVFDVAKRLFGLSFRERHDVPTYHPDVRAFEVTDHEGRFVGLFLGDYFARPSKRSGAWMTSFRDQEKVSADTRPIVLNVMNFSKSSEGRPALLSFDDARTLFHEFGHALHGLLSDVTYPLLAGTNVARDFVEFPSQLFEHWLEEPSVLKRFAVHHETGEPMPDALMQRLLAARKFNQGFATVEYVSSALADLEFHSSSVEETEDVDAFERAVLERIGMPKAIVMRHRPAHFSHVFAGDGYSAAYYSYLWSEVLDADGFGAFEEAGDPFDCDTARRLRDFVYAAGNLREPAEAYRGFRGRDPAPAALLRQRGLLSES